MQNLLANITHIHADASPGHEDPRRVAAELNRSIDEITRLVCGTTACHDNDYAPNVREPANEQLWDAHLVRAEHMIAADSRRLICTQALAAAHMRWCMECRLVVDGDIGEGSLLDNWIFRMYNRGRYSTPMRVKWKEYIDSTFSAELPHEAGDTLSRWEAARAYAQDVRAEGTHLSQCVRLMWIRRWIRFIFSGFLIHPRMPASAVQQMGLQKICKIDTVYVSVFTVWLTMIFFFITGTWWQAPICLLNLCAVHDNIKIARARMPYLDGGPTTTALQAQANFVVGDEAVRRVEPVSRRRVSWPEAMLPVKWRARLSSSLKVLKVETTRATAKDVQQSTLAVFTDLWAPCEFRKARLVRQDDVDVEDCTELARLCYALRTPSSLRLDATSFDDEHQDVQEMYANLGPQPGVELSLRVRHNGWMGSKDGLLCPPLLCHLCTRDCPELRRDAC